MKLYTKEQLLEAYELSHGLTNEEVLEEFTPIELPINEEVEPVMAVIEDCDWYIVPNRLYEDFRKDTYNEKLVDSGEFDGKWGKYKTNGDLNLIQLYSKIK